MDFIVLFNEDFNIFFDYLCIDFGYCIVKYFFWKFNKTKIKN